MTRELSDVMFILKVYGIRWSLQIVCCLGLGIGIAWVVATGVCR